MAYVSRWERLPHAVMRVMAACGLSKEEAQTDICRAIADGTVEIRGELNRHTTKPLSASDTVLSGSDLQIPTEIKSEHLDWERSRPVKPWMVRRGRFAIPGYWDLAWIELSRADVTNVLCVAREQDESTQLASSETPATSTTRPALESTEMPTGPDPGSAAGPRDPGPARSARHRGPQPKKREQARDAMRSDIQRGRRTVAELESMLEKNLSANYGGFSRDTARKARTAVLSEFAEN